MIGMYCVGESICAGDCADIIAGGGDRRRDCYRDCGECYMCTRGVGYLLGGACDKICGGGL